LLNFEGNKRIAFSSFFFLHFGKNKTKGSLWKLHFGSIKIDRELIAVFIIIVITVLLFCFF